MGEVSDWLCGDLLSWVKPWQVGALSLRSGVKGWLNLHWNGWEHPPVATRDTDTSPLEHVPLSFGQQILSCQGLLSVVEPSGSIKGIVPLLRSSWLTGVSCQVPAQVWGVGGTKLDWEKELENVEKVLSTPSSGSTPAAFGCSVTCGYLCMPWECSGAALASSACLHLNLAGRTNSFPSSLEPVVTTGCLCWH